MPFAFERTEIPDVVRITSRVFDDERGSFVETFKSSEFAAHGIDLALVQANESRSARGVLRGLHYQRHPHALGKLVRVLHGAVIDVALDVRRGSPSFGRHVRVELHAGDGSMLWIPPGFAHGICALHDDTHFLYLQSGEYAPDSEAGVHPLDPALGIDWPFEPARLRVSGRDLALPTLAETDVDFTYEPDRAPTP